MRLKIQFIIGNNIYGEYKRWCKEFRILILGTLNFVNTFWGDQVSMENMSTLNNESSNNEEAETIILALMLCCGTSKDEAEHYMSSRGIDKSLSLINPLIISGIQLKYGLSESEAQKLLRDEGLKKLLEDEGFRKIFENFEEEEEKVLQDIQQTQGVDKHEAEQILDHLKNKLMLDKLEKEGVDKHKAEQILNILIIDELEKKAGKLMDEEIIPLWIAAVQKEQGISETEAKKLVEKEMEISEDEVQKLAESMLKNSEARLLSQNTPLQQSQIIQNHNIRNKESSYNKILVLVFIIAGIFVAIFFAFCSKTTWTYN